MDSKTIREKYLKFFEEKGHKVIDTAPLVLKDDPTTLFTSSGMQPLVPYLLGKEHPGGKRVVDIQKCFRGTDIEDVGDMRHGTFFEMMGNWSFGDYFKKEQLAWVFEFITNGLKLDSNRLHVTIFNGDEKYDLPKDNESFEIWKRLGIPDNRIHPLGIDKNWWSRFATPEAMPEGEPGGPDSEMFYEFPEITHDLKYGEKCHPHCDCGHFIEIGNSVFMQYQRQGNGFIELPNKNVDFGGSVERMLQAADDQPDVFRTDIFYPIIDALQQYTSMSYDITSNQRPMRIVADHVRASVFLILDGVLPANKEQGYILRRLLRRAAVKTRSLTGDLNLAPGFKEAIDAIFSIYSLEEAKKDTVNQVVEEEINKFIKTLDKGLKEIDKIETITGKLAFDLYQTYGFPLEITKEIFEDKGQNVNEEEFKSEFEAHKEQSRSASAGMFKGGLVSTGEVETKYHTATHLLHAALRQILGDHVIQRGSNINFERLRFDFAHNEKLTEDQIKQVEDLVNQQIQEDLPVTSEEMDKTEAENSGAIHAFGEKYGDKVTVYSIGEFSKEFCGGPHVTSTGTLGTFKIQKEEASGSGIRRIYANLS